MNYKATHQILVDKAANYCGISPDFIMSHSRKQEAVFCRHVISYILYQSGATYKTIQKLWKLGNHTTVLSSVRRVKNFLYIKDPKTTSLVMFLQLEYNNVNLDAITLISAEIDLIFAKYGLDKQNMLHNAMNTISGMLSDDEEERSKAAKKANELCEQYYGKKGEV